MPLLDHFHAPLYPRHRWHGFHNAWATYIAAALNQTLPDGYFAEPTVQFSIDIWYEPLTLGNILPTMPLWLRDGPCMPVELEATYQHTCREQRISTEPIQEP